MELSFDNDCSYSELVIIGMKRKRKLTKILAFLTVLWEYRLDLFHHIQTLRLGGELHLAPLGPEPGRILDVGTGTGI